MSNLLPTVAPLSGNDPTPNAIHGVLRLKDDPIAGPLRPARNADALLMEKIARNVARGVTSSRQLLLTTGFGLHASMKVPVRLPALAIPGLRVMERMQDLGLPVPSYLLYHATDFIAETNGLPLDAARECSARMETYLQGYIQKFHSRIAEHVRFRFACGYPPEMREAVKAITEDIHTRARGIATLHETMEKVSGYEARHSNGRGSHEAYAAANALYSGATEGYPFTSDMPRDTEAILPIGGNAEKPFFALTSLLAERMQHKVVPMLTLLGSRPTYYHYPHMGDPSSISEYELTVSQSSVDGPIRADIGAMVRDGAIPDALAEIYPQER